MNLADVLKDKNKLKYRQGAIGLVLNHQNQILLVQMVAYADNEWRFPGGGIDEGEEASTSLLREFSEELGSDQFEIIAQSKYKAEYEWSDEVIKKQYEKRGEFYKGQQQHQFLVKFNGKPSDLKPDPNELKNIKWVPINKIDTYLIFPGQLEIANKVLAEFNLMDS